MQREIRDELGVPGHVVVHTVTTAPAAISRVKEIMAGWERKGYRTPNDVPEGPEKQEVRDLLRALRQKVAF